MLININNCWYTKSAVSNVQVCSWQILTSCIANGAKQKARMLT